MAQAPTQEPNVSVQQGAPVLKPTRRAVPVDRSTPTPVRSNDSDTVQVWPHLVVIEFLGAVVITINIVLLATLINGPLDDLANPDRTPNPSKAPWYFLNLQELLLHMNPALAGVIVPTLALVALAIIPYFDKGTKGLGVWFYSKRGPRIIAFSFLYTTIVLAGLIAFDKLVQPKAVFQAWLAEGGMLSGLVSGIAGSDSTAQADLRGVLTEAILGWIFPTLLMVGFIILLLFLLRIGWRDIERSEVVIALFTGFLASYTVLTFVGTAMRGPGMDLFPPWAVPPSQKGGMEIIQWVKGMF
jgi:quinol-cytochrome oxidoreductase complex cytochrome b subunit